MDSEFSRNLFNFERVFYTLSLKLCELKQPGNCRIFKIFQKYLKLSLPFVIGFQDSVRAQKPDARIKTVILKQGQVDLNKSSYFEG